jgi:4-hydroxy-tetrahydrodipicolinate reductase
MIKLAISGACGKMGSRIADLAAKDPDFKIAVCLERSACVDLGLEKHGTKVIDDVVAVKDVDVIIEFTCPEATVDHLKKAKAYKKAMVIGTTGLKENETEEIKKASLDIPLVYAPNMSVGVNIVFDLVRRAAAGLSGYTASIKEAHHIHKKDAPSGTAKKLASIIEDEKAARLDKNIKSIREGEIIGDHEIAFESPVDAVTIRHSAKTRDIFVLGALRAAKWIVGKKPGLYGMNDVLS